MPALLRVSALLLVVVLGVAGVETMRDRAAAATPATWVGANVWGLAASSDVYACGASEAPHHEVLAATFDHLRASGITVVRFWAFQSYATNDRGERDWRALDRVFAAAQAHEVRLIPVLGNNWTDCDYWPVSLYPNGGQRKGETDWYRDDHGAPYDGYLLSYDDWLREAVGRYRRHEALLAWELVNEPRARSYSRDDAEVLATFLRDSRAVVRSIDRRTPVSFGMSANGEPGFDAARYRTMASASDLATAHDYGAPDDPMPYEGCTMHCLSSAMIDADDADRPFYVGESGIDACDTETRARLLTAKMQRAFERGAAGYVFWAYDERARPGACGFEFGPQSPLLDAVARARGLR